MAGIGQSKLFNYIFLILFSPVYLLAKLIPKNRKLYVFGSSLGHHCADNSKYLFLYASKHISNIKSVFISRNRSLVEFLIKKGYQAEYLNSFQGIRTVLRAKKAFLSNSTKDIHPLLLGGAEIIQLWHGTPLKKIGYDADWKTGTIKAEIKNTVRRVLFAVFPFLYSARVFDKIVISSPDIMDSYLTAFKIPPEKTEIIGQPRNDCLNPSYALDENIFDELEYLENLKDRYDMIISWLPTHRGLSGKTIVNLMDEYGLDFGKFDEFLRENNIAFVAKPHVLERDALKSRATAGENIIVYDYVDPYPLLRYTNILITDYSSVYFDFLLTGKPVIFTPFDFDDYCRDDADFYYDYDSVTPGPKCRTWDEITAELKNALACLRSSAPDPYAEKRKEICGRFNYYNSDFCRRVTERFF